MTRPQNSAKGYIAKERLDIGGVQLTYDSTDNLLLNGGLQLSDVSTAVLTADSTGNLVSAGGIEVSGVSTGLLTANSTGLTLAATQITGGTVSVRTVSNSTGVGLQLNSTGTTWVWFNTTTAQPT